MRLALPLALVASMYVVSANGAERSPATFKVSESGKDKASLAAVFNAVQNIELKKAGGDPRSFLVIQVFDAKKFLVQPVGEGTDNNYLLIGKTPRTMADREVIRSIYAVTTGKTHSYNSVAGAKTTVRIIDEIDPPPLMKTEEFVARLKAGDKWTLKSFQAEKCKKCFGDGKLSALQHYADCPDCSGKGEWKLDLLVIW